MSWTKASQGHRFSVTLHTRGDNERARLACERCGCVEVKSRAGRTRYFLPGRNPVLRWPPKCKDRSAPPTDGAPGAPQAPTPSAPG